MPLINCKIHLKSNWIQDCILFDDGDFSNFKITDAKLHVPIVTLSTKDNVNLTKQLSDGFKRSAYWNSYQTIPAKVIEKKTYMSYLVHHIKVLKDYSFLLMLLMQMLQIILDEGFKFQPYVCNGCHHALMMSINITNIAINNKK